MASTDSVVAVKQVAVLGTGIMGSAMARNLAAAGMRTVAWDRSRSAVAALAEAGVISAASPDDAVREAQVVITMLPTAGVVRSIMLSAGVISSLAEHAVWAQMGTIGATATTQIAEELGRLHVVPAVAAVDAGHGRDDVSAARLALGSVS